MERQEDKTIFPNDLSLYNQKPRLTLTPEERQRSIHRSRGNFHEWEKDKNNTDSYMCEPMDEAVKDQATALKNRCYYQTSTVDGFFMHIHRQFHNALLYLPQKEDAKMKLLLMNGRACVEIEDRYEIIKKKLMETTRNSWFNFYHAVPQLMPKDIGDSIFEYSAGPALESKQNCFHVNLSGRTANKFKTSPVYCKWNPDGTMTDFHQHSRIIMKSNQADLYNYDIHELRMKWTNTGKVEGGKHKLDDVTLTVVARTSIFRRSNNAFPSWVYPAFDDQYNPCGTHLKINPTDWITIRVIPIDEFQHKHVVSWAAISHFTKKAPALKDGENPVFAQAQVARLTDDWIDLTKSKY